MQGVLNKEPRKSRRRVSTREVATRYRDSPRNERGGARVRARVYTGEHRATRAPRQRKPESSRSPTQCVSPGTRLSEITTLHTCPYRVVQGMEPSPGTRNLLQRLLLHSVNPFTEKSFVNGRRRRVFFPFTSLIQSFDRLKQNENFLVRGENYIYIADRWAGNLKLSTRDLR